MKIKVLQEVKESTVHYLCIAYKWGCPELHGEGIDIEVLRKYPNNNTIHRELFNLDKTEIQKILELLEE